MIKHTPNHCPKCQKYNPPQHELGIECKDKLEWYADCDTCGIAYREVYNHKGTKFLYHNIYYPKLNKNNYEKAWIGNYLSYISR